LKGIANSADGMFSIQISKKEHMTKTMQLMRQCTPSTQQQVNNATLNEIEKKGVFGNAKVSLASDTFPMTRVRKWKESFAGRSRSPVIPNSPSCRDGAIAVSQTSHANLLNIATVCCALGCGYRTVVYNIQVTSFIARLRAYDTAVARNVFRRCNFWVTRE
jgi:hypothetical protein